MQDLALVNIILVFGRDNDRNVQRFVNGRFGDRMWMYLCIKIIVSNHVRHFFGPNAVTFQSERRPKIVILHLQSLYKVPKKSSFMVILDRIRYLTYTNTSTIGRRNVHLRNVAHFGHYYVRKRG